MDTRLETAHKKEEEVANHLEVDLRDATSVVEMDTKPETVLKELAEEDKELGEEDKLSEKSSKPT